MEASLARFLAKKAYFSTFPERRCTIFPGKTAEIVTPALRGRLGRA
jgi:hypothetical protein